MREKNGRFSFLPTSTSSSSLIGLPLEPLPDEEDEDKEGEELSLDDSSERRNHFLRSGRSFNHWSPSRSRSSATTATTSSAKLDTTGR
jgi:hypothetical protein